MAAKTPVAQYVRMSSERQDCSIEYQSAAIAAYASGRNYEIVRTYEDAGISGLTLGKRAGLRQLLADVVAGTAPFDIVLVYDVSRWGRFQNPDQSAHYEFLCAEAGVAVEYCAEPFVNDGSPTSMLLKHIKRAMAAEYSRELSQKARMAKLGLRREGYWMGSAPGYGLRRQIVTRDGRALAIRELGEWGRYPGAHTKLVLGPREEVETVRRMYRLYLQKGGCYGGIARQLNAEGISAEGGALWTTPRVRQVLTNEKYVGCLISGRWRHELGGGRKRLPQREWLSVEDALEPLVPARLFRSVQRKIRDTRRRVTEAEALDDLRRIFAERGQLSEYIIKAHGKWSMALYQRRLGSLEEMYARLGYTLDTDDVARRHAFFRRCLANRPPPKHTEAAVVAGLKALWARAGYLSQQLINEDRSLPHTSLLQRRFGGLRRLYELIGYTPTMRQRCGMRAAEYSRRDRNGKSEASPDLGEGDCAHRQPRTVQARRLRTRSDTV